MRKRIWAVGIWLLAATALEAETATYRFVWQGKGGYALQGALAFDQRVVPVILRENDLSCFFIEGSHDEKPIGRWDLSMLLPDTVWRLHFDTLRGAFLVEGDGPEMPQAWNMDGDGTGCGQGGFGFNLGNVAQDLCVNDQLIVASQVDPFAPFPAVRDDGFQFPFGACKAPPMLSQNSSETAVPARLEQSKP